MGHVMAAITLSNYEDTLLARRGKLSDYEVRKEDVHAMVDTGATMLVINEDLFNRLGLEASGERITTFANSAKESCRITEPVEIRWEDRTIALPALVVKNIAQPLLGVLPLEGMDLIVDPVRQQLAGAHGDRIRYLTL